MDESLRSEVWQRANGCCEYCRIPQSLIRLRHQIDHVIAIQHGGTDDDQNLVLICQHCNLHKGPNIASLDPESGKLTALFHPRRDHRIDHLELQGALIVGKSAVGRATVIVLALNDPLVVAVRDALILEGVFPLA